MYAQPVPVAGKHHVGILIETLLLALQSNVLSEDGAKHSFASVYGQILDKRNFVASPFFRSITSQLYIVRRDILGTIASRLNLIVPPQQLNGTGKNFQIESLISKKWEEMVFAIPQDTLLGGVEHVMKAFTPNVHLSLWCALKTPQMYLPDSKLPASLCKDYPDVCIAYRALLSFPRVVNVHDWAMVFASVLGFSDLDDASCTGRFLYALRCLLLVGVVRSKSKREVPDFVERCNLGDACQF